MKTTVKSVTVPWSIRKATIADADAIFRLHGDINQRVTGIRQDPGSLWEGGPASMWQWWVLDNPTRKNYCYVAEFSGRIISHYSNCGIWLNIGGEKKLATYAWGRLTHQAYRRRGIATSLDKISIQDRVEDGVDVGLGLVNELGLIVAQSSGAHILGQSRILLKILNPYGAVKIRTGSAVLASISKISFELVQKLVALPTRIRGDAKHGNIVEINYFDEQFDRLWLKFKGVHWISVWKDSEYLNWRYISRPNGKYQIQAIENDGDIYGFIVLRFTDGKYRVGHIVDLLFLPGKEAYAMHLIADAVDRLREGGADIAICHLFKHDPCYHILIDNGFFCKGQDTWTVRAFVKTSTIDVTDVRNWLLMRGTSAMV